MHINGAAGWKDLKKGRMSGRLLETIAKAVAEGRVTPSKLPLPELNFRR